MGVEYYLCDREKQEVLYYGKSFFLSKACFVDPSNSAIRLTTTIKLRETNAENEADRMTRAALWCEGRSRIEVISDTDDPYCPWEECMPLSKATLKDGWIGWTANALLNVLGKPQGFYLQDEGWRPVRLEGE